MDKHVVREQVNDIKALILVKLVNKCHNMSP